MNYSFNFSVILQNADHLIEGMLLTIRLSAMAMLFGLLIGTACAVAKLWGPRAIGLVVTSYVEFIRNTPFLVQLFVVYFGLPSLGFRMSAESAAVVGLSIYMGAYATEIVRSGIQAIPKTQIEAALCLGMHPRQVFRHVLMFPALQVVYPALTSQFVLLLLGSSVVSLISARELFHVAAFLESRTFLPFEIYLSVSLLYLGMSLCFRGLFWVAGRMMFAKV
ncbi:amino acid ABC transporter permease [Comamonadaceae bacterium G21597-S1]|nr:amino acid ABC transporter permease [Comamonadaceae bacterium G21597-S1]